MFKVAFCQLLLNEYEWMNAKHVMNYIVVTMLFSSLENVLVVTLSAVAGQYVMNTEIGMVECACLTVAAETDRRCRH